MRVWMQTQLAFNIVEYVNFETMYRDRKLYFKTFISCWHLITADATEPTECHANASSLNDT